MEFASIARLTSVKGLMTPAEQAFRRSQMMLLFQTTRLVRAWDRIAPRVLTHTISCSLPYCTGLGSRPDCQAPLRPARHPSCSGAGCSTPISVTEDNLPKNSHSKPMKKRCFTPRPLQEVSIVENKRPTVLPQQRLPLTLMAKKSLSQSGTRLTAIGPEIEGAAIKQEVSKSDQDPKSGSPLV
jgi:hypothetical protein